MTQEQLDELFEEFATRANLNAAERIYFGEDISEAKKLGYPTLRAYYSNPEIQWCLVNYATPDWRKVAKNGLGKILEALNI